MNKTMNIIFAIVAVLAMGLALYEQNGKIKAQEQAKYYAEHYTGALQELTDKAEADVELQACLSDANYGDYCAVEYLPSGEISDVVLVPEGLKK